LCFCDEGRSSREAALFGYFLALLPKSNSPAGENPRLQIGKAERRVMKGQRTPKQRWIVRPIHGPKPSASLRSLKYVPDAFVPLSRE
jgi:hypothetical protein